MSICLVSSKVLCEHLEMKDSETNPLMRSLPQVVFTAAFQGSWGHSATLVVAGDILYSDEHSEVLVKVS